MTPTIKELLARCVSGKEPHHQVFTYDDGRPVRDIRKAWRKVCVEAKVPNLLFHDLRRTAARNLRNSGVAEGVVMKIGGWKTRSIFERYAIVDQDDMSDALVRLERRREIETLNRAAEQAEQDREQPVLSRPI